MGGPSALLFENLCIGMASSVRLLAPGQDEIHSRLATFAVLDLPLQMCERADVLLQYTSLKSGQHHLVGQCAVHANPCAAGGPQCLQARNARQQQM
eukprot:359869-Chlamydomonas_euryale.AAC.11